MLQTITITVRDWSNKLRDAYCEGFKDGGESTIHIPPQDVNYWYEGSETKKVIEQPLQLDLFADE